MISRWSVIKSTTAVWLFLVSLLLQVDFFSLLRTLWSERVPWKTGLLICSFVKYFQLIIFRSFLNHRSRIISLAQRCRDAFLPGNIKRPFTRAQRWALHTFLTSGQICLDIRCILHCIAKTQLSTWSQNLSSTNARYLFITDGFSESLRGFSESVVV